MWAGWCAFHTINECMRLVLTHLCPLPCCPAYGMNSWNSWPCVDIGPSVKEVRRHSNQWSIALTRSVLYEYIMSYICRIGVCGWCAWCAGPPMLLWCLCETGYRLAAKYGTAAMYRRCALGCQFIRSNYFHLDLELYSFSVS